MSGSFLQWYGGRGGPSTEFDVWILAGQSNMLGLLGDPADLPAALQGPQAYPYLAMGWSSTDVLSAFNRGLRDVEPLNGSFGPEITFTSHMVTNGRRPCVIKVTKSGTTLAGHWQPTQQMYVRLTRWVDDVLTVMPASRIRGFVWLQGTGDAADEANSLAYEANLAAMMAGLRGQWGSGMPLIFGLLNDACTRSFKDNVRAQQNAYATADTNSSLVDLDAITDYDGVHYGSGADGLQDVGTALSAAALATV